MLTAYPRRDSRHDMTPAQAHRLLEAGSFSGVYDDLTGKPIPASIAFTAQTEVALSSAITSNSQNITGDTGTVWPVCVRGDGSPQLEINGSGIWATDGNVRHGDTIKVRLTSSGTGDTALVATLYIPGSNAAFSVTTTDVWMPIVLSPSLWNRADSLGLADNASVNIWTDDSGNGRNMAEATFPPTFKIAILNGLPIVRFDGTNNKMDSTVALSAFFANNAFTIFMVFKAVSITTNGANVYDNDSPLTSSTGGYLGISLKSAPTVHGYNYDGNYDTPMGIAIDTTDFHIYTYRHESGNLYMGLDGNTENSAASGNTAAMTDMLRYGATYNGSIKTELDIAEAIVFSTALSSGDNAKVQGYLAWKYGLESLLPGSHPYAGGPP